MRQDRLPNGHGFITNLTAWAIATLAMDTSGNNPGTSDFGFWERCHFAENRGRIQKRPTSLQSAYEMSGAFLGGEWSSPVGGLV